MADRPTERDPEAEAARFGAELDQAAAGFRGIARGLALMHDELAPSVGRREARRIVRDVAHNWAVGTFSKTPDLGSLLGGGRK